MRKYMLWRNISSSFGFQHFLNYLLLSRRPIFFLRYFSFFMGFMYAKGYTDLITFFVLIYLSFYHELNAYDWRVMFSLYPAFVIFFSFEFQKLSKKVVPHNLLPLPPEDENCIFIHWINKMISIQLLIGVFLSWCSSSCNIRTHNYLKASVFSHGFCL